MPGSTDQLHSRSGGAIPAASTHLSCRSRRVGMGRCIRLEARVTLPDGAPAAGYRLLPFVDGKRWGAHETADAHGRASWSLPLPRPGLAEIRVQARPPREAWIWLADAEAGQTVFLQRSFELRGEARGASLWVATGDSAEVFINGHQVTTVTGGAARAAIPLAADLLRANANALSVRAHGRQLPAAVLLRLELDLAGGRTLVLSDRAWKAFGQEPAGWPHASPGAGEGLRAFDNVGPTFWPAARLPDTWPDLSVADPVVGAPMVAGLAASNAVRVRVDRRQLITPPSDPEHLVGLQYCTLFSPSMFTWGSAQAVPVVGFYRSWDPDVLRQHLIWLAESGIDFLMVDWCNNIWGVQHWDERPDATNEVVHSTTMLLEEAARMRDEGLPTPRIVLFLGVLNGPPTTMVAVNEQIDWVYHHYVRNPRFRGLFVELDGKPLMLIFNGGGPDWLRATSQVAADDRHFTIRWMSSQHQDSRHHEMGYWTWMDGVLRQPVTCVVGRPEAMTVSTAFFNIPDGWTAPTAYGRRGGVTYVESFKGALEHRPRFLQIHQFQEFTGALDGQGWGPKGDGYGDTYSVELSDDVEPVSVTAPGYRGAGGWGFHYLNLTRALVDLYRQETPQTTVVAISRPAHGQLVSGDMVELDWTWAGKPPSAFRISANGRLVMRVRGGTSAAVPLRGLKAGPVRLRVTAEGAPARYVLSRTEDSLPAGKMKPAFAEVEVIR